MRTPNGFESPLPPRFPTPIKRRITTSFRAPILIFLATAFLTFDDLTVRAMDSNEKNHASPTKTGSAPSPLPITVFYSTEDPHWVNVEKLVDQIARQKGASVVFRKVCIDTPEGYRELADLEKKHAVEKSGDLTVAVKDFVLTSQGSRREAESYLEAVINRFLEPERMKERREANVAAHAKRIFGADANLTPAGERPGLSAYRVLKPKEKKTAGWIVEVYRTIACGLCRSAHFLIVFAEPDGKVADIVALSPIERFGKNIPEVEAKKFLNQFVGQTASPSSSDSKSEIKDAPKPLDAISGATKTSRVYETGVTEAARWLEILKAESSE